MSSSEQEGELPFSPAQVEAVLTQAMNNCLLRGVVSMGMGAGLGFLFGVFFGTNMAVPLPEEGAPKIPLRIQMWQHLKESGRIGMSQARNFAFVGAIFATTQCVIEKQRGHSHYSNGFYAGCISGGVLAYKGGTTGMALGCASFGAFSLVIDRFMEEEDPRDAMRLKRFDPYDPEYLSDIQKQLQEEEEETRLVEAE